MIYKIGYFKVLFFLLCCQLGPFHVLGQVRYSFAKDTIAIKGGETFSNVLRVTNPYMGTVILTQDRSQKKLYNGLIALPDSLVLKSGESRSFPLKYIADRQTLISNIQRFTLNLVAEKADIAVQKSAWFMTQLTDVGGLTIGTEDNEIYLSQMSNQAQVVVRCVNNGFVPLTFRLLLTGIPDGLEFTGQTMSLTLQPGSQQLLPFLARNKTGMQAAVDFTVTIQAMDERNNQLAVKILRIVNITSARKFGSGDNVLGSNLPNTIALRYASTNNNSSFYQLQGNGSMKTGNGAELEYRFNADQYHQPDFNGVNIYNTYLNYQAKSWGVKVGNIYENIDFQLGGRGIKASANLKERGILSFYGIQNNFLLYDQNNSTIPGAKIFAVDYDFVKPGAGERRLTYLRSHDTFTGLDANQVSMKTGFKLKGGQILGLEGGYSLEDQNSGPASPKQGLSAGLNYALDHDDYQFYGNGYYSSPYFTGLRRGLFLTDVRLLRKFGDAKSLTAHVSLQVNNPKFQSNLNTPYDLGINKNAVYIYELGYTTKAGNFYMGFNPYFMAQHLVSANFTDIFPVNADWKSSSLRFAANLGYNGRVHSFSMSADYGYTYLNTAEKPPAPFHSLKVNGNYNMPIIGFNGYLQLNPFYLTDLLSSTNENTYSLYSLGPNIHFSTFKNSLSLQFGGMYNYYGFTHSNNYSATGNVRYLMKGYWALTADFQYTVTRQNSTVPFYNPELNSRNSIDNLYFNNRQLRVGIEKQFGRQGNGNTRKLALTYYEDHNSNGQRDPGENAVAGILVKINSEAALTNSKGEVEFTNMKKEAYTVSVTNTKGWSLQEPTNVFLDKNKRMEIPLVRTQALNGCLKLIATKYMDDKPVLAGIRINAVDPNGHIHQTMTDDQGMFCFYLPRNQYTVYIETEGMPFSIQNGKEQVLLQGTPVEMLTFLYKDERRKVGVTRF